MKSYPPRKTSLIRERREALGMSTAALAQRLGVSQSTVVRLERSESQKTISLATLERAAEAMNCVVKYSVVSCRRLSSKRPLGRITGQKRRPSKLSIALAQAEHQAQEHATWESRLRQAMALSDFVLRFKHV